MLGRRLVLSLDPASTLTLSSALAAILLLPAGVASGGAALHAPDVLLLCLGVAMVGNVLPYLLELLALALVPAATYGVLLSLEPAVAALVGLTVLGQSAVGGGRRGDRLRRRGLGRREPEAAALGRRGTRRPARRRRARRCRS